MDFSKPSRSPPSSGAFLRRRGLIIAPSFPNAGDVVARADLAIVVLMEIALATARWRAFAGRLRLHAALSKMPRTLASTRPVCASIAPAGRLLRRDHGLSCGPTCAGSPSRARLNFPVPRNSRLQSPLGFGMRSAMGLAPHQRARGLAQLVRAAVSKTAGREFESLSPCHLLQ